MILRSNAHTRALVLRRPAPKAEKAKHAARGVREFLARRSTTALLMTMWLRHMTRLFFGVVAPYGKASHAGA